MASFLTIVATTSSSHIQPHHHVNHISIKPGMREFRLENALGCETCIFFPGEAASVLAEGGSLFPSVRGSIGGSC